MQSCGYKKERSILNFFYVIALFNYLQNFYEVKFDVGPQLLDHLVDKLDPVHVGMNDPRW